MKILTAENLSVGYTDKRKKNFIVQRNLSFSLKYGELTCILGANGSGKSTLLRTLAALQPPLAGNIYINGRNLKKISEKELSQTVSIVLTDQMQVGGLKVKELVAIGRQPHTGFWGHLSDKDNKCVEKAMEQVGITCKANSYMAELSDGERQKTMIAKALAQECPIIVLDEPTAYLDASNRIEIMVLLHKLAMEEQRTILLSTHDVEQALVIADCLWLLSSGGMVCGVTEDMIMDGMMDRLFSDKHICFDACRGTYYPYIEGLQTVYLQCENEKLAHWITNALNRNGFLCKSIHGTSPSTGHVIIANSSKEIKVQNRSSCIVCRNIEELIDAIKSQPLQFQHVK